MHNSAMYNIDKCTFPLPSHPTSANTSFQLEKVNLEMFWILVRFLSYFVNSTVEQDINDPQMLFVVIDFSVVKKYLEVFFKTIDIFQCALQHLNKMSEGRAVYVPNIIASVKRFLHS